MLGNFESVRVWLFDPPSDSTAVLKTKLSINSCSALFKSQVQALRKVISAQLVAPTLFGGQVMNARTLTGLVSLVVDSLNRGETVMPQSTYISMIKTEMLQTRARLAKTLDLACEKELASAPLGEGFRSEGAALKAFEGVVDQLLRDFQEEAREIVGGSTGDVWLVWIIEYVILVDETSISVLVMSSLHVWQSLYGTQLYDCCLTSSCSFATWSRANLRDPSVDVTISYPLTVNPFLFRDAVMSDSPAVIADMISGVCSLFASRYQVILSLLPIPFHSFDDLPLQNFLSWCFIWLLIITLNFSIQGLFTNWLRKAVAHAQEKYEERVEELKSHRWALSTEEMAERLGRCFDECLAMLQVATHDGEEMRSAVEKLNTFVELSNLKFQESNARKMLEGQREVDELVSKAVLQMKREVDQELLSLSKAGVDRGYSRVGLETRLNDEYFALDAMLQAHLKGGPFAAPVERQFKEVSRLLIVKL